MNVTLPHDPNYGEPKQRAVIADARLTLYWNDEVGLIGNVLQDGYPARFVSGTPIRTSRIVSAHSDGFTFDTLNTRYTVASWAPEVSA